MENKFDCLPDNEILVRRAIINARPSDRGSCVRWAAVSDTFGLGCTYSMLLCRKFDLDPEKKVCLWMDPHDEQETKVVEELSDG